MLPSEAARADMPWEPPELALKVGDRVVVRLGGECERMFQLPERFDGRIGLVACTFPESGAKFPIEVWFPDTRMQHRFARAELRRLAAPDPRAGDGDHEDC